MGAYLELNHVGLRHWQPEPELFYGKEISTPSTDASLALACNKSTINEANIAGRSYANVILNEMLVCAPISACMNYVSYFDICSVGRLELRTVSRLCLL